MSGGQNLADLPENIADIKDEATLIKVLNDMYGQDDVFSIHDGFIYMHTYCSCINYEDENLFTMSYDDIQYMYQYFKRGLSDRYKLSFQNTKICGREYFMLGGKFTLIAFNKIYEQDDLIFYTKYPANYIVRAENGNYYSVPDYIQRGIIEPYTPIKSNFKFNKFLKASGEKYFKLGENNYRHTTDPYDIQISFMCSDTYDIVNSETGERVKTWPLKIISSNYWETIKETIEEMSLFCAELKDISIKNTTLIKILLNEQWNQYYLLINKKQFYELRRMDSGRATKAAATDI